MTSQTSSRPPPTATTFSLIDSNDPEVTSHYSSTVNSASYRQLCGKTIFQPEFPMMLQLCSTKRYLVNVVSFNNLLSTLIQLFFFLNVLSQSKCLCIYNAPIKCELDSLQIKREISQNIEWFHKKQRYMRSKHPFILRNPFIINSPRNIFVGN